MSRARNRRAPASRRWIRNAADALAVRNGCHFSERHAEHVADFFRQFLRHSKGQWAGKPFELLDWQRDDIVYPMFGWLRPDGSRRFRRAYIEIPKKNGKSTLAAGIGLYMLVGDGEQGAQVFSAAADRSQASIVHGEAINMVDASAPLTRVLEINRSTHNIHYPGTRSFYRALSSEAETKEGFDGHACIIDELHVWKGRGLWDALKYMGRARRQPLIFIITTAGDDALSVCKEQHDYAEKVAEGTFQDDRYFAYIRSVSQTEIDERGVRDRTLWHKANPSMGKTIDVEEFGRDVEEACRTPTAYASFLRYSFNVWNTGVRRWLNIHQWRSCVAEYSADELANQRCYGGLDLASQFDTASCALVFPVADADKRRKRFRVLIKFWLPESRAEVLQDQVPYRVWRDQGLITLTDGDVCDYEQIVADVCDWARTYRLQELGFDPWNAEGPTQEIERRTGVTRVKIPQTVSHLTYASKELEKLIVAKDIEHDGHAVLDWQIGNVDVFTDSSGNIKPKRPDHADARKIDGVAALVMALDRALRAPPPAVGSLIIT